MMMKKMMVVVWDYDDDGMLGERVVSLTDTILPSSPLASSTVIVWVKSVRNQSGNYRQQKIKHLSIDIEKQQEKNSDMYLPRASSQTSSFDFLFDSTSLLLTFLLITNCCASYLRDAVVLVQQWLVTLLYSLVLFSFSCIVCIILHSSLNLLSFLLDFVTLSCCFSSWCLSFTDDDVHQMSFPLYRCRLSLSLYFLFCRLPLVNSTSSSK